jgi:hypothetical protein
MPEPTATNPQTGEKLVLRNGQWVPLNGAPAPAAGPVYGAPPKADAPPVYQPPSGYQGGPSGLAPIPGGPADPNAPQNQTAANKPTEVQGKAASFLIRALGANKGYEGTNLGARNIFAQAVQDRTPNLTNTILNSGARQVANSAQDEFIAASLRQDSGAAIPPEEMERQRRIYFPMPGDGPEALQQKKMARMRAIEGLRMLAGPLREDAEARFKALEEQYAADADIPFGDEDDEEGLSGTTTDEGPPEVSSTGDLGPDGKPRITGNDPGYMQVAAGFGNIAETAGDLVGLVGNPLNQTINWATGSNLSTDLGQTLRQGMGLPYGGETIDAVSQAVAGGLGGAGLASSISRNIAPGVARNALAEYGSRPAMDMVTGGSAAASGEAARALGAGPVVQTLATVAGGATPSALMGSRNALATMGRRPPPDFDPGVVQAGQRQGIPIRRPDAAPSLRGDMANTAQTPNGGPMIATARNADQEAVEARIQAVGGEGNPSDPFTLGSRVQGAGTRFIARTREQANRLYRRADEAASGARVAPRGAIETVDRHLSELEAEGANTNAALITYLRGLRADLGKQDGFSVTEFQGLRSGARKKIKGDQALTATDAERRLTEVAQAFTADAGEQLPEAASSALQGADQFYAERQDFINGVLRNVMGTRGQPLPAERAAERLVAMTKGKGDQERFSRMWSELEPDEQADLAATVAASLGRKANGDFSLSTLVRSLDPRTGVNPRTARLVFGEDGARALADLRTIASAKTATQQGMNNSNTGATVTRAAGGLKTLMLGALGYSAGGPVGAVAGGLSRDVISRIGEQRAARLLLNPDFTRWLRNAPNTDNPQAINSYFGRLTESAAKSQVYAGDVKALQEALAEAFSRSPGRLAAAEQEQD